MGLKKLISEMVNNEFDLPSGLKEKLKNKISRIDFTKGVNKISKYEYDSLRNVVPDTFDLPSINEIDFYGATDEYIILLKQLRSDKISYICFDLTSDAIRQDLTRYDFYDDEKGSDEWNEASEMYWEEDYMEGNTFDILSMKGSGLWGSSVNGINLFPYYFKSAIKYYEENGQFKIGSEYGLISQFGRVLEANNFDVILDYFVNNKIQNSPSRSDNGMNFSHYMVNHL